MRAALGRAIVLFLAGCGPSPEYYYQQHGVRAPVIGPFASAQICETARKEMEEAGYYVVTSSRWRRGRIGQHD